MFETSSPVRPLRQSLVFAPKVEPGDDLHCPARLCPLAAAAQGAAMHENGDIEVLDERTLLAGWSTVKEVRLALPRQDGSRHTVTREVSDHGNAAAVLLCDPERGTVVLVRQFRYPPHVNGDAAWLIEACAGLLDGDDPETCARREAEEETGFRPSRLLHAFDAYPSPGALTEKVSCFIGLYDADCRVSAGGGLAHEGEDIEVLEMPFAEAYGRIATGGIVDAKTIMLLQHAALTGIFTGGTSGNP
jgi:nudix-type nucleoside diphosphatase (YffH/AdpP family)